MSRLVVAVDPGVGVSASALAGSWNGDDEAGRYGEASVEAAGRGTLLPDLAELVTIPLAVNLASNVVYDLTRRLVVRLRDRAAASSGASQGPSVSEELEVVEHQSGEDRLVVVRMKRVVS